MDKLTQQSTQYISDCPSTPQVVPALYLLGLLVLRVSFLNGVGIAAAVVVLFTMAAAITLLTAFLGGGVILNVLKEEVPSERQSRFWAFALGMAGYAALLLTL